MGHDLDDLVFRAVYHLFTPRARPATPGHHADVPRPEESFDLLNQERVDIAALGTGNRLRVLVIVREIDEEVPAVGDDQVFTEVLFLDLDVDARLVGPLEHDGPADVTGT